MISRAESALPVRYLVTWMLLVALTTTTFLVSYAPLGSLQLPVAIAIAAAKALLVLFVFMHIREQPKSAGLTVIIAVGFVLLLMAGALTDVATRLPFTVPNASEWGGRQQPNLDDR